MRKIQNTPERRKSICDKNNTALFVSEKSIASIAQTDRVHRNNSKIQARG